VHGVLSRIIGAIIVVGSSASRLTGEGRVGAAKTRTRKAGTTTEESAHVLRVAVSPTRFKLEYLGRRSVLLHFVDTGVLQVKQT